MLANGFVAELIKLIVVPEELLLANPNVPSALPKTRSGLLSLFKSPSVKRLKLTFDLPTKAVVENGKFWGTKIVLFTEPKFTVIQGNAVPIALAAIAVPLFSFTCSATPLAASVNVASARSSTSTSVPKRNRLPFFRLYRSGLAPKMRSSLTVIAPLAKADRAIIGNSATLSKANSI